jgi:hypothetical protein
MRKTIISLAAASLVASSAMAADKGVDFTTTGQAVVYYNTLGNDNLDLFDRDGKNSKANFAIQLNNNADLGNGFGFGSQISYLGTAGLEKNLVKATMQTNGKANDLYVSKLYITKKVANTTVKMGRQELPKSLSPLAFSEGWNVFKNTFDAIVAINTDLPKTTLVGAYVSKTSGNGLGNDMSSMNDLVGGAVKNGAYMLTAKTTMLPLATLTGSFYSLRNVDGGSVNALWVDAQINKSLPMGLKVGVQFGSVTPDTDTMDDATTAFGVKAALKPMAGLTVIGAFTNVSDGSLAVDNTGTNVKTPLYTQMVANQGAIKKDNSTMMLKGVYSLGKAGKVIAQASMTSNNASGGKDNTEIDLLYKTKAFGMNLLAAYVRSDTDGAAAGANNIVRFVARYNF